RSVREVRRLDAGTADEVALGPQGDDAAQAGLGGEEVAAQLVAVQGHPGLEAEGVAAGEAARGEAVAAGRGQLLPQGRGELVGDVQLEAVLSGVPGAGDQHRL